MKVALYARVSTVEQNAENQLESMRKYAEVHGLEIYQEYKDQGVSGLKDSRPAFDQMLQDMREFKFKAVMVVKLDRMGRSLKHIISLFDEFQAKGVGFIATTQNIDTTTAAGRLQMQIIGAFAEFERNLISERTKEGLKGAEGVGKRGKDRKPRKKGGYYLRHSPRLKIQGKDRGK